MPGVAEIGTPRGKLSNELALPNAQKTSKSGHQSNMCTNRPSGKLVRYLHHHAECLLTHLNEFLFATFFDQPLFEAGS